MLPSGKKLGGAPVNFLYHAKTLGADVRALTRVGADPLGDEILASLDALGVPRDMIQISRTAPTGTVDVKLDSNGSPTYAIVQNVAWDEIEVDESVLEQTIRFLTGSRELSAFYYGSLALRSSENRAGIERIFEALPNGVARVCDLNLRAPFYDKRTIEFALNNANVFKLNDVEAVVLDEMFSDRAPRALADLADGNGSLGAALRADLPSAQRLVANWASNLLAEFNLQSLVVTCGEEGAFLFDREGFDRAPSPKVAVKDTVGAGDSFSAR